MRHTSAFFIGLLAACAPDATTAEPDEPTPSEVVTQQGAYKVGYVHTEFTYQPVGIAEPRTLPVEVWYPVDAATQGSPATYVVAGVVEQQAPIALSGPDIADDTFPVAIYSHGSGGNGLLAYRYAEHFASHGWIVVSADHVGNTSLDLLTGGASFLVNSLQRPQDVSALLDAVDTELDPAIDGHANLDAVFMFGHSFGGYTTFATAGGSVDLTIFDAACSDEDDDPDCATLATSAVRDMFTGGFADDRIDAIAPQAPALAGFFDPTSLQAIPVPMLLQSAKGDITTPDASEAEVFWDARTDDDDRWLRIPNGGHMSFISICDDLSAELIAQFQPSATRDGCGPDFAPLGEIIPSLSSYMLAFANVHVLDQATYADVFAGEPLSTHIKVVTP